MTPHERAFVDAFRDGSLPTDRFHHRDHVHMAWLYVREHGALNAVGLFSADLRAFAHAKGVPGLFHATITWAYFSLVAERLSERPPDTWETFADANADLLQWKPSVLDRYYSPERLWSDPARQMFLLPDGALAGNHRREERGQEDTAGSYPELPAHRS